MTKLTFNASQNNYEINNKRAFKPELIQDVFMDKALDFAYAMVYGDGHHRDHRTGGSSKRKKGEIFCNTFQGKLAEIILYHFLQSKQIEVGELDFGVHGEGTWDDCDLVAYGKRINIKSAASFANLLLLEAQDWDELGNYLPNVSTGQPAQYDYFVLLRFKPDVKNLFNSNQMFFTDQPFEKNYLQDLLKSVDWSYDIPGCMSTLTLKELIRRKYVIPRGAMLNHNTKVDATNYYFQAGNLKPISFLVVGLKGGVRMDSGYLRQVKF